MTRVLITGAAGMLGKDLAAVADEWVDLEVQPLDRYSLDITDCSAVDRTVGEFRPDVIINCAAWTDVDGAETSQEEAYAINELGPKNIANAATDFGAFVVNVSTDYVFAGDQAAPYLEDSTPNPQSVYGRSKLAGDIAVAQAAPDSYAIARTSWLFGEHGPNFIDTILNRAESGQPLRVVADQIGCPTWTGHLAPALLEIGLNRVRGITHLAGSDYCSWFELAQTAAAFQELDCTITPVTSADFPRPAPRPKFSVLKNTRPEVPVLPTWRDGVRSYVQLRNETKAGIS